MLSYSSVSSLAERDSKCPLQGGQPGLGKALASVWCLVVIAHHHRHRQSPCQARPEEHRSDPFYRCGNSESQWRPESQPGQPRDALAWLRSCRLATAAHETGCGDCGRQDCLPGGAGSGARASGPWRTPSCPTGPQRPLSARLGNDHTCQADWGLVCTYFQAVDPPAAPQDTRTTVATKLSRGPCNPSRTPRCSGRRRQVGTSRKAVFRNSQAAPCALCTLSVITQLRQHKPNGLTLLVPNYPLPNIYTRVHSPSCIAKTYSHPHFLGENLIQGTKTKQVPVHCFFMHVFNHTA